MAKLISFHDVAKHKCKNDCWILVHGKVYDVSTFMDEHPGGDNVLLAVTGKDASIDYDDVNHSDAAKEMMEQYCIGDVDKSTVPVTVKYIPPWEKESTATETTTKEGGNKMIVFLIPLLILVVAFYLRFYNKK